MRAVRLWRALTALAALAALTALATCTPEDCPLALKFARQSLAQQYDGRSGDACTPTIRKYQCIYGEYEFRCDYRYDGGVQGWLKLHRLPATWQDARLRCHLEGATLASPLNYALQAAIQSTAGHGGADSVDIFTGIHATFSKGDYVSIEGVPLSQIAHAWAAGGLADAARCVVLRAAGTLAGARCRRPRPFVCYKTYDALDTRNRACGTLDSAYVYSNSTGSCYKLHSTPRTYARAHMACAAEGGYLAIVNSDAEAEVLRGILAAHPPDSMVGQFDKEAVFVGLHAWAERGDLLTINGQSLSEAGYARAAADGGRGGERSGERGGGCGALLRSARLARVSCARAAAFLCEKSPASLLCDD